LVREALRAASEKRLLKVNKSELELTALGRSRLKVVMVGGAFEIVHPGHVHTLSAAKKLGNTLVVVVATDESVLRNKGRPPVTNQDSRVTMVSSLRQVDLAIPGNKGSIYEILLRVRPDVVAVGYDQVHNPEDIVREAAKRGVRMQVARLETPIPEVKTSKILQSL
jgi:cytidyltransferase-like protein